MPLGEPGSFRLQKQDPESAPEGRQRHLGAGEVYPTSLGGMLGWASAAQQQLPEQGDTGLGGHRHSLPLAPGAVGGGA